MKKKFSFLLVLAVLVMGLSACGGSKSDTTSETKATKAPKATETAEATKKPESKTTDTKGKHHAKIKVKDYGTIEVELDGDTAPITVANFIKLVNEKFYDGLTFHRIMSGFMIQGGDPLGNGMGKAVAFMVARSILSSATHSANRHSNTAGKNRSEFKANNTGNTHNRSNASSRSTAHNSSRANMGFNGGSVNNSSHAGFNSSVRNSSSVNSADFGKTAVTGTNSNRFGGNKTPGQKGDARVDNKNTAIGRNAANTARNATAVGGKKNNPGAQKYGGKFTGTKICGAKEAKNTAWRPDKSFSHNPVGKRFGQTDTPPEAKPEKAVENEPKQ